MRPPLLRCSSMKMCPAIAVVLASGLAACADDPLSRLRPKIAAEPPSLDFGAGIVARDNAKEMLIKNIADGVLEISGGMIEPSGSVFRTEALPSLIGAHASAK